jgi:hypothetical protein
MDLATILSLISTAAIVAGVVFAGIQIREATKQRAREAETVLTQSFQSPEFMRAMDVVLSLPEGLSREAIAARLGDRMDLVMYWNATMENIGVLVYHHKIRLDVVEDFFSGPIVQSWRILRVANEEHRKILGRATMYEWFQWLAERIAEREARVGPPVPAHIEHADWGK